MTVIVAGVTKNDGVVIAADSQISYDSHLKIDGDGTSPKLWVDKERGYIFGGCGSLRHCQVLQYHVEWPKYRPDEHELMKFAVTEIVPAIRVGVEDHGILKDKSGVQKLEANVVMAWGDTNILGIGSDFSVEPSTKGRLCDGSGYAEAYGSLGDKGIYTKDEIIEAARRATLTAGGVGGDIYYVSSKDFIIKKA